MQTPWWLSVLAVGAPLADMCGEAPDEFTAARKIVEPPKPAPPSPATAAATTAAQTPTKAAVARVNCPRRAWPARFAGQLAGLGWVSYEDGGAHLVASTPGAAPTGPDPLPPLTVVRQTGTLQADPRERTMQEGDKKRPPSVSLTLPLPAPWADDRVAFITSACLPNAAATLRVWTFSPLSAVAPDFDALKIAVDRHVQAGLRPGHRSAWERRGGVPPAGLGSFATTIPGCARLLAVNADLAARLHFDFASALLCVADDGTFVDVLAPQRGRFLRWVAVADLDGDGVDEVLVHREAFDRAGRSTATATDELLWHTPGPAPLAIHVLSHVVHGA
jgi:hypothetical protein